MKKRLISMGLVAAMALAMLAGCGGSGGSTGGDVQGDPEAKKFPEEGKVVSWWLMGGADEYYQYYWSEMKGLQAIQNSVGIQIDFQVATGYESYLPMMASEDYPDVITAKNLEQYRGRMAGTAPTPL